MAKSKTKKKSPISRLFRKFLFSIIILVVLGAGAYFGLERFLEWYIVRAGRELIEQEKRGELSREYGYVWSEINLAAKMGSRNREMTQPANDSNPSQAEPASLQKNGHFNRGMPSLAAIRELNRIQQVSNYILITDRHDYPLGEIKTTHTRLKLNEFNDVLTRAIIYSEDRNFYTRVLAYEYKAFVRAFVQSLIHAVEHRTLPRPRGTSTIHQQVAKFLLAKFDARGHMVTERSLRRKLKELKLAQALKMYYTQDELLLVYLNHCVNAGYGLTGYYDISTGLFGKKPDELDICQSLYLARMVKWNRNIPAKIMAQIKIDMPRMAPAMGWSDKKQDSILLALNRLKFLKPTQIVTEHNPLVDLANEYWLKVCRLNGMSEEEVADMDFSQAGTMIRRKGNLKIQLTIDLRLQKTLEALVNARGYGRDTTILTDVRIGSLGRDVSCTNPPRDSLRVKKRLGRDSLFSEPGSRYVVKLRAHDTLVSNIRYKRRPDGLYRRSVYFYRRDTLRVPGQYYCYAMMNSATHELLAYYSRDGIGSRLSSLLRNKTPNGSSVAKPILFALNYDLGHFQPWDMITDSVEVEPPAPWARKFLVQDNRRIGMIYSNTSAPGGYPVSNHGKIFEGYDYVYNHLMESNNLLCVEMIYRLNTSPFDASGAAMAPAAPVVAMLERIGDTALVGNGKTPQQITGTQLYARIAEVTGAQADSVADARGRIPLPPDYYSVALGTLELSLYQQMHLFNVLYNNELAVSPESHPGLVIKSVSISGEKVPFTDSLLCRNLFRDMAAIRPVQLGLHKRLVSNAADGLEKYDIMPDSILRPANFAKSGTSDDIIRPYNRDVVTREKTNYGLWNAVLRLAVPAKDYAMLSRKRAGLWADTSVTDSIPESERMDVTLACVGECNERNTGARDGKTLHKFASAGLLRAYGIPVDSGFFAAYEKALVAQTPDSLRFKNPYEKPDIEPALLAEILAKSRQGLKNDSLILKKRLFFGYALSDETYARLLGFTPYFGREAGTYYALVERVNSCKKPGEMALWIEQIRRLPVYNPVFKEVLESSLKNLLRSISQAN